MSTEDQTILSFKKHPFRVYRDEIFVAAFSNENCAAVTAIFLQRNASDRKMRFSVHPPGGRAPVLALGYKMNPLGNRIVEAAA